MPSVPIREEHRHCWIPGEVFWLAIHPTRPGLPVRPMGRTVAIDCDRRPTAWVSGPGAFRPRLQRRDRGGFSPPSLFPDPYSIVRTLVYHRFEQSQVSRKRERRHSAFGIRHSEKRQRRTPCAFVVAEGLMPDPECRLAFVLDHVTGCLRIVRICVIRLLLLVLATVLAAGCPQSAPPAPPTNPAATPSGARSRRSGSSAWRPTSRRSSSSWASGTRSSPAPTTATTRPRPRPSPRSATRSR